MTIIIAVKLSPPVFTDKWFNKSMRNSKLLVCEQAIKKMLFHSVSERKLCPTVIVQNQLGMF